MKLPETPQRDREEIELQRALGPSVMETQADSSPERRPRTVGYRNLRSGW